MFTRTRSPSTAIVSTVAEHGLGPGPVIVGGSKRSLRPKGVRHPLYWNTRSSRKVRALLFGYDPELPKRPTEVPIEPHASCLMTRAKMALGLGNEPEVTITDH